MPSQTASLGTQGYPFSHQSAILPPPIESRVSTNANSFWMFLSSYYNPGINSYQTEKIHFIPVMIGASLSTPAPKYSSESCTENLRDSPTISTREKGGKESTVILAQAVLGRRADQTGYKGNEMKKKGTKRPSELCSTQISPLPTFQNKRIPALCQFPVSCPAHKSS